MFTITTFIHLLLLPFKLWLFTDNISSFNKDVFTEQNKIVPCVHCRYLLKKRRLFFIKVKLSFSKYMHFFLITAVKRMQPCTYFFVWLLVVFYDCNVLFDFGYVSIVILLLNIISQVLFWYPILLAMIYFQTYPIGN